MARCLLPGGDRADPDSVAVVQLVDLDELVILDPAWLARVFTSVITRLDSDIDDRGSIERRKLRSALTPECSADRVIALLRHFQLCLPLDGTDCELFPCRLPLGRADATVWPPAPRRPHRQVSINQSDRQVCTVSHVYSLTAPSNRYHFKQYLVHISKVRLTVCLQNFSHRFLFSRSCLADLFVTHQRR